MRVQWLIKVKEERKNFCFVTFEREETMKEAIKTRKQTISQVDLGAKEGYACPMYVEDFDV